MKNSITIDFGNIVAEMKDKNINLCLIKDKSWFVEDSQKNLYQIDLYKHGSYLDNLIKNGRNVTFNIIKPNLIEDWEKEIWTIKDVEDFIKRQSKYWIGYVTQ